MCNSCKVTQGITWTNLNIYIYSKSYKKKSNTKQHQKILSHIKKNPIPNSIKKWRKRVTVSKLYSSLDTEVEEGFDNSGAGGFSSLSFVPEHNG